MLKEELKEWEERIKRVKKYKEKNYISEIETVMRFKYPIAEYFKARKIIYGE